MSKVVISYRTAFRPQSPGIPEFFIMTLNDFFRRTLSNIEIVSNCFLVNRYSIELYFDIDIRRDRIDLVLSLSTSYWFGCSSKSYWFVCFFMDIVRKTIISISIDIVSHVFSFIGIVSNSILISISITILQYGVRYSAWLYTRYGVIYGIFTAGEWLHKTSHSWFYVGSWRFTLERMMYLVWCITLFGNVMTICV